MSNSSNEKALAGNKCEACRADAPPLSVTERETLLPQIPRWSVVEINGIEQLKRVFKFDDFVSAQAFTNKVADLAEKEGHHPAILLEWGRVTVRWWTHKIRGLHRNDVIMAAKCDRMHH